MIQTVITDSIKAIPEFLAGGGEMGQRIREYDWSVTSLGPVETWPQSLRTCIRIMLTSRQPIWIGWGKELIKFYNDPYKDIAGGKHPWALGKPASFVWKDIWKEIGPMLKRVMEEDEGTYVEAQLLIMDRNGYEEETYYTFSYTPIPGDNGGTAGMICANSDDTKRIISDRQLRTLTELGKRLTGVATYADVVDRLLATVQENPYDFPFTFFYPVDNGVLDLTHPTPFGSSAAAVELMREAVQSRSMQLMPGVREAVGMLSSGVWNAAPDRAIFLPIGTTAVYGILVIGMNPYRLPDEQYGGFFNLIADQMATSFSNVFAMEEERKRMEALAAIDQAKTTFFSNISHEFRTPLTLLLGPIVDALNDGSIGEAARANLGVAYRNALRMQKLVNTLLDFSRIEAGRMEGRFSPVDIGSSTADLASTFRAAIEKAGMELRIDIGPVSDEVYVDEDMWEKIVLNLVSNAFKYTKEGTISVAVRQDGGFVRVSVVDTGIGIAADQQEQIFERFHRIDNADGRSQEGTGIGLAMVRELVRLHHGSVELESVMGKGSRFTVVLPVGKAHLPAEKIVPAGERTGAMRAAYAEETGMWLSAGDKDQADLSSQQYKILLADDNADMRDYVHRLLSGSFRVLTATNGEEAYHKTLLYQPDLLLTDIMMPKLDGFGLLAKIRANPVTRHIPVIFLSARAGEEAKVEGLEAGADDYLVKPFAAKELLAVIHANIKINGERWIALQRSNEDLQQFAHVASHDLKEPLRKIRIFSGRLGEDELSVLSERGRSYLGRIQDSVERLMTMVEGVLAYSSVNASEQVIGEVDLQELMRGVERDLELVIAGKQAVIRYEHLPVIEGAEVLLYQLFYNLISNALKFASPERRPAIGISWTMTDEVLRIEIEDNGIGFAPEVEDRIFMTFARLHSKDKYEGTGLGLALCKRIVARHGGTISARGELGKGAVFVITLPARQSKASI